MKLGLIARADHRGLGYQTKRFHDALKPEVTVAVRNLAAPQFETDQSWYPDAIWTDWRGYGQPISSEALKALLRCDVIYTAETYYDERLPEQARKRGIRLVLHCNPEFYRPGLHDVIWLPTTWRVDSIPTNGTSVEVVEVPCPDPEDLAGSDLFVHVGGHKAAGDRNGSTAAWWASGNSKRRWRLCTQDRLAGRVKDPERIEVVYHPEDWQELYRGGAVLVAPRSYGGLSIPALEAMASGLALAMPAVSPNTDWPILELPSRPGPHVHTVVGPVSTAWIDPRALVSWADNLEGIGEAQARSRLWARQHCWSALAGEYRDRLAGLT